MFVFARTIIRYRVQKQILLDDIFFYLGVLCLCAAFGVFVQMADFISWEQQLDPNGLIKVAAFTRRLNQFSKNSDAYMALTYTTLFSVKLSFLLFFRILVRRIRKMIIYWWTVLAIMCIAWPVSVVAAVASPCPVFGSPFSMVKSFNFLLRLSKLTHYSHTTLL